MTLRESGFSICRHGKVKGIYRCTLRFGRARTVRKSHTLHMGTAFRAENRGTDIGQADSITLRNTKASAKHTRATGTSIRLTG